MTGIGGESENESSGVYSAKALIVSGELIGNGGNAGTESYGVNARAALTIQNGGMLKATSGSGTTYNYGLYCNSVKIIDNCTLEATAAAGSTNSYGIYATATAGVQVTIPGEINSVTASGETNAIYGKVKNAIAGTGWSNTEGTVGQTSINTSEYGQSLTYMKVKFPAEHVHNFAYTASENTITATCNVTGCPLTANKATLTIVAPAKTTYGDANSAVATITDANSIKGEATVSYFKADAQDNKTGSALTSAPEDAGKYWAEITVGERTAHVVYTIAKATETAPANAAAALEQLTIDYTAETISANTGYGVAADDSGTAITDFSSILDNATPTVYVRKNASDDNHAPSAWVEVTLAARPSAPTGLGSTNSTNGTSADGTITDVNDTMEYSAGGTTWTPVLSTATTISGLNPGTYSVRVKATDSTPHGVAATVTVGSNYVALDESTKPTISVSDSHNPPVVGDTLTASTTATDVTYQWYRGNDPISGAMESTYILTANDAGKAITVKVTQTKQANGSDYTTGAPTQTSDPIAVVVKKNGPAAPTTTDAGFSPNYPEETFSVGDNYEVSSTSGDNATAISSLTEAIDGTGKIYIRAKETADTKAGAWLEVELPSRPAAPTSLTTTSATNDSTADGKIKGTTNEMEYKLKDSNDAWSSANDTETAVAAGTYLVRVKANASTPHGKATEVTVGSKEIVLSDEQKPTAKTGLKYTGSEQALINASTETLPAGATEMLYAIGTDATTPPTEGWSTSIPKGSEAKTYYVWYKAAGDEAHTDTKPACVTVTIDKSKSSSNITPKTTIKYSGQPQELVTSGEVENGTMMYALGSDDKTSPALEKFSPEIPKGTEAKIYYVWYYAKGDEGYEDTEPACITVEIVAVMLGTAIDSNSLPQDKNTSVDLNSEIPIPSGLAEEAKSLTNANEKVELKLVVTPMGEDKATESETLKNDAQMSNSVMRQYKDESTVSVEVLEIDIEKYIDGNPNPDKISQTKEVIEIAIPYDLSGKYDPRVVRKHDGKTDVFRPLSAYPTGEFKDGTFYADTENNVLYIYSNRFSTYVVAYSKIEGNAQPIDESGESSSGGSSSSSQTDYPKTVPVYRLFNSNTGEHFYTASKEERDLVLEKNAAEGWIDEGIAFETANKTDIPVYRVFDMVNGQHIYTVDAAVRDAYVTAYGYRDEGIAWYAPGRVGRKVYKLTHTNSGKVTYTTSLAEADMLKEEGFECEDAEFVVY